MIIDGHAHACGELLTPDSIARKLKFSLTDMIVLTAGQLNSKKTFKMKNYAYKKPYEDVLRKINKKINFFIPLTRMIKSIPSGNEYVYDLKKHLPDKVRQFYWITKGNSHNIERDYERMGFDGIKFHQCWENFDICGDWFENLALWAESKDLPIFIHLNTHKDVVKLINFIMEHPNNKFIIAHLYGVELFINNDLNLFDNVFFDISNSYFVSKERILLAYEKFGSSKLLLGSDSPYGLQALEKTIYLVDKLNISPYDKDNILGNNMMHLLKIK